MKELVEYILKGLTGYVPLLVSIIATPKRTISKLTTSEPDRLNKALTFAGFTIALAFVFQAPLVPDGQDFVKIAGSLLVLKIVAYLTFSGLMVAAFRLVGGKGNYLTTLCACLFITSPVYLFQIFTHVVSLGIISTHDPGLATIWNTNLSLTEQQIHEFFKRAPGAAIAFSVTLMIQFLSSVIWFLICWGAYRNIHQVSRIRSAFVYLITTVLWYSYWWLTVLAMKGLHGGAQFPMG